MALSLAAAVIVMLHFAHLLDLDATVTWLLFIGILLLAKRR